MILWGTFWISVIFQPGATSQVCLITLCFPFWKLVFSVNWSKSCLLRSCSTTAHRSLLVAHLKFQSNWFHWQKFHLKTVSKQFFFTVLQITPLISHLVCCFTFLQWCFHFCIYYLFTFFMFIAKLISTISGNVFFYFYVKHNLYIWAVHGINIFGFWEC